MKTPLFLGLGLAAFSLLVVEVDAARQDDSSQVSARIDSLMQELWKEKKITPNPVIDDATFLRRIYLDVVGRIPSATEAEAFLADDSKNKRSQLIDDLLDSEGYVNHYFNYWADILRINNQQGGGQNVVPAYTKWTKDALRENMPYDQFVRELISAKGDYQSGSLGYYYRDRGMPLDNMANTVRIFLGTRLECAQCHNHPFDKWTQMDFFHMAAFSYGIDLRNQGGKFQEVQSTMQRDDNLSRDEKNNLRRAFQEIGRPLRNRPEVSYNGEKLPQLPHDYQYDDAEPKEKIDASTMFGKQLEVDSPGTRLEDYAAWMTSPENPRFTKVIANRLWKRAFGLGLVEPVDEWMDQTQPVYPEMLDFLEKEMVAMDYDMKEFLRALFNTKLYQRKAVFEDIDDPTSFAFAGPVLRRMSAEQIWDSVVTLINPSPDQPNWKQEKEVEMREVAMNMMTQAIEARPTEKLIADARRIAGEQKKMQKELERLQKEQLKARQDKDQDKARELAQQTNRLRTRLREQVYETVYQPALKAANLQVTKVSLPAGMGAMQMKPTMLDNNGRPNAEMRKQLEAMEKQLIEKEMDRMGIDDEKERRSYYGFRRGSISNYARAANLTSPAPPGHFLRQFGQSDRETIENAEKAASVPQALTLLNGPLFQAVANPMTVVSRAVKEAETPEEKIETIYLSFVSRYPDKEERELLKQEFEGRGDQFFSDLGFALMNSQEFLFVR